jgi:hypothetical protein
MLDVYTDSICCVEFALKPQTADGGFLQAWVPATQLGDIAA